MIPSALNYAICQANNEGWNIGLDDDKTFRTTDQRGFFLAKLNGKNIGCASAVCYNEDFAFFGFYIIEKEYPGQGYGMQITQARLDYVGERCVGLDGVIENQKMYQKIGFKNLFSPNAIQLIEKK